MTLHAFVSKKLRCSKKKFGARFFHAKFGNAAVRRRLTHSMNTDFKILIDFLDHFGPEVAGRQLSEPKSEAAAKLERFARGQCTKDERSEVCDMLHMHPAWLRWLADRVKLARATNATVPD